MRDGRAGRRPVALAVLAALAFAAVGEADTRELPLTGQVKGEPWRIEAAAPPPDDDVPASWCLRLEYSPGIDVVREDDDPAVGVSCGPSPAPRVSGSVEVECGSNAVFVLGGARVIVRSLVLETRRGRRLPVTWAQLPRGSGVKGRSFAVVTTARNLPARLLARGAGQRVIARISRRKRICAPGSSDGLNWAFGDFASRR